MIVLSLFKLVSLPILVLLACWIFMNYTGAHQFFVYLSKWDSLSVLGSEVLCSVWLLQQLIEVTSMAGKAAGEPLTHCCSKKKMSHSHTTLLYFYKLWLSTLIV